ncbi:glycoside hydrolase family 88 protein [Konateibacter massiliensis]|uniref:glycoside hydrolase family 88 protein n=1 Tax=Konateibacter massiliensis TaxID=2002841 RepID=UPI000C15A519|nr:glycoside hydrolase family 88 protein [Konateibacter massiliensis]
MSYKLKDEQKKYVIEVYERVEKKLTAECRRIGDKIPYIPTDGRYTDMAETSINWWTNGFWAGIMWQMYHATNKTEFKEKAVNVEKRLDTALANYEKLDHDLGFLWLPSAVANYRLTGDEQSRCRGLIAASLLASRFNIEGKFIRAWNAPASSSLIIDCLMNLPLLYWASEEEGDPRFAMIAKQHTRTAMNYLLRQDGSCNHIAEMDENTGEFLDNPKGQGFEKGSSWSRGQAWSIYGMTLAYRYTKETAYLDAAKKAAHYFISNAALTGYVSLLDFRAPKEPLYYDTTATACAACGLLELSAYVSEHEKDLYVQSAYRMLQGMSEGFVDFDIETDGILQKGSARYDRESDREVPIIYGDYYFVELLLRFMEKDFMIW